MKGQVMNLFMLKAAALLHDPPHKPYLLVERKGHEKEAKHLAQEVLGEQVAKLLKDKRVKAADKISSSIDRWVLSLLMGNKYIPGLFSVREIKLKNIFEPTLEVESIKRSKLCDEIVHQEYVAELKNYISKVDDWRLKYHLLYALYELLWVYKGLAVGPADTRVPTHTVFDHVYASAAMINWFLAEKGEVNGLLVGLDVAGVQEFIAASRKLRDMWVSSYIVSALTWYTVVELVEKLGPDIVIMPSMRMNPFYIHWLARQKLPEEVRQLLTGGPGGLVYLSSDVKRMYDELKIPPYPLIPGRVTLVLPPWSIVKKLLGTDKDSLEEYFNERFRNGWKLLWRIVKSYADRRVSKGRDIVWELVKKVFDHYDNEAYADAGFHEAPPLRLRVACVEVRGKVGIDAWRLYDEKYHELVAKLAAKKYVRESASVGLNLYELTRKAFDDNSRSGIGFPEASKKGFDCCTSCGKHPALLILPRGGKREYEEYVKKIKELIGRDGRDIEKEEVLALVSIFSPGERLCPWCFLKRVVGLEPRLLEALILGIQEDEANGSLEEFCKDIVEEGKVEFAFPSTSHVASARFYEKILELNDEKLRELVSKINKDKDKYIPPELTFKVKRKVKRRWAWRFMEKLAMKLESKASSLSEEGRDVITTIFNRDPEDTWFNVDRRSAWLKLLSEYNLNSWLWRYYALIKADGDSIGDLLEGKLTALLLGLLGKELYCKLSLGAVEEREKEDAEELLARYIKHSCEGDYSEFITACLERAGKGEEDVVVEEWAKLIAEKAGIAVDEARERIENVVKALRSVFKELRIPVTPTYHVALSAALVRAALLDAAIIAEHDGFIVYAGGDDLLAFAPVDKSLDIVRNTRLAFGGFGGFEESEEQHPVVAGEKPGFLKVKNVYLPMLSSICRSYSLYIAHYHYPLSAVLSRATTLLEEAKDKLTFEYYDKDFNVRRCTKDFLITAYSPRGGEESTVTPLSWSRPVVQGGQEINVAALPSIVKKLLMYIDERFNGKNVLSRSILYDFMENDTRRTIATIREPGRLQKDPLSVLGTLRNFIKSIVDRNAKERKSELLKEAWEEIFEPLLEAPKKDDYASIGLGTFKKNSHDEGILLLNVVEAARLVRSGMR